MKISELILQLEKIKEKEGDLSVFAFGEDENYSSCNIILNPINIIDGKTWPHGEKVIQIEGEH